MVKEKDVDNAFKMLIMDAIGDYIGKRGVCRIYIIFAQTWIVDAC